MTNIREQTPRELMRGLMRGDRSELKLGYTAGNAALATQKLKVIDNPFVAACVLAYGHGFAAGMISVPGDEPPADVDAEIVAPIINALREKDVEIPEHARRTLATEYRDGFFDGTHEAPSRTYPAAQETERTTR